METAIIEPVRPKKPPDLGRLTLLVSSLRDLVLFEREWQPAAPAGRLFTSRLYSAGGGTVSAVGPLIGAPYAVMLLETLIAWGARRFLFLGWCGAVASHVRIGDVVLPEKAMVDEGTSRHYNMHGSLSAPADHALQTAVRRELRKTGVSFHEGLIWTTDAPFRETPTRVAHYQRQGVLAVEMEVSALFNVAHCRAVSMAAMLAVSDEIASFAWRTGFKDPAFQKSRETLSQVVKHLCRNL